MAERRYIWLSFHDKCFMGFILGLSDTLVLIHRFRDFEDNGHAVIRRSAIDEVQCSLDEDGRSLRFFESMMRREGLFENVGLRFAVALDSFASVANAVQGAGRVMLFNRGPHEPEGEDLHVGQVLTADDLHIRTHCITAYGEWREFECELDTPTIEWIEFGSPYLKALKKYAPRQQPGTR